MNYYKSENGITMMTLVITIIILVVVSSIMIYSGVNTYQSMIKQSFIAELQMLQTEVNKFSDIYKEKASNLGLPSDDFRRAYYNEFDKLNGGTFEDFSYEEQQSYLEFYNFVNEYNGFSKKVKMNRLEKLSVIPKKSTGGLDSSTDMYFIPPVASDGAKNIARLDADHVDAANGSTLEADLKTVWNNVMATDGANFLKVPVGGNIDNAIAANQRNYFYFTKEMIKAFFNIDVSTDFAINFDTRYVISVTKNIEEDDGYVYHTEYSMKGGKQFIEHALKLPKKNIKLDFDYKIQLEPNNKRYKITIIPSADNTMNVKNMYYYAGYTPADNRLSSFGNVLLGINGHPELTPKKSWNLIEGSSFYTSESEMFGVKIVDINDNVAYRVIKVTYVNAPEIGKLIPIVLEDATTDKWRLADKNETWYDYENGMWANAMIDDVAQYNETTKEITTLGSTFVWIPRFAYRIMYFATEEDEAIYRSNADITRVACYSDNRGLVKVTGTPMSYDEFITNGYAKNYLVEIKFLNGTKNTDYSGVDVTEDYGGNFKIHKAFYDPVGDREISGFWVSKNKLVEKTIKNYRSTNVDVVVSTDEVGQIQTKNTVPKLFVKSYMMRNNFNLKKQVYTATELENNVVESHMIKNIEYGAIQILTAAKMDEEIIKIGVSNVNTKYGLYDLFTLEKTHIAATTRNSWNAFDSEIKTLVTNAKNNGWITANQKAYLESNSLNYFDEYPSGNSMIDAVWGDGIYEFIYMEGTDYYLNFLNQGIIKFYNESTKPIDFFLTRGTLHTEHDIAVENIIAANYEIDTSLKESTRAVLIIE